jgi:hypothetical protein
VNLLDGCGLGHSAKRGDFCSHSIARRDSDLLMQNEDP